MDAVTIRAWLEWIFINMLSEAIALHELKHENQKDVCYNRNSHSHEDCEPVEVRVEVRRCRKLSLLPSQSVVTETRGADGSFICSPLCCNKIELITD